MYFWYIWNPDEDPGAWQIAVHLDEERRVFKFTNLNKLNAFPGLIQLNDPDILMRALPGLFATDIDREEVFDLLFKQSNAALWLGSEKYSTHEKNRGLEYELAQLGQFLQGCLQNGQQAAWTWYRFKLKANDPMVKSLAAPRTRRRVRLGAESDEPDYTIEFINNTGEIYPPGIEFNLDMWGLNLASEFAVIVHQPVQTLQAGDEEQLAWYNLASDYPVPTDSHYGYVFISGVPFGSHSRTSFGFMISVPVQFLGIGRAPYYSVSKDQWGLQGEFTSEAVQFPADFPWNITVVPTATHSTMTVSVIISDRA